MNHPTQSYIVDPVRFHDERYATTGIIVRAVLRQPHQWVNADIGQLDRDSLELFLASGPNVATRTVLILLGWNP